MTTSSPNATLIIDMRRGSLSRKYSSKPTTIPLNKTGKTIASSRCLQNMIHRHDNKVAKVPKSVSNNPKGLAIFANAQPKHIPSV